MKIKKKGLVLMIIAVVIAIVVLIGIEFVYQNIIGVECCQCKDSYNDEQIYTNCTGAIVTNCIECCECNYDLIRRITTIYDYYTN